MCAILWEINQLECHSMARTEGEQPKTKLVKPPIPKIGRPLSITDPKLVQRRGMKYIEQSREEGWSLTWTGLALACGFRDRAQFNDYATKDEFSHVIKPMRDIVASDYEQATRDGTCPNAMGIFALKNFGWTDRSEVENTQRYDLSNLSDEELQAIASGNLPAA